MTDPTDHRRRGPLYRRLQAAGARFAPFGHGFAAQAIGAAVADPARPGLADLSAWPRIGFKGWNALDWLSAQALTVPAGNNQALRGADGVTIARMADSEALILGPLDGATAPIDRLDQASDRPDGCYPVPRVDGQAVLLITGDPAPAMLAKLCAIDLRPHRFADLAVAQTDIAGVAAIVIRHDLGPCLAYSCHADIASAEYLWDCLTDAMTEFDGHLIGLEAVQAFLRYPNAPD